MAVSLIVAERYQDISLLIAALLHDTVEDCEGVRMQDIYTQFGDEIWYIVDGVSAEPLHFHDSPHIIYEDKIEKILAWGTQDIRVILLKLADRDHNLDTLDVMNPNRQIKMAFETQAIYEPLKRIIPDRNNVKDCYEQFNIYLQNHYLKDVHQIKLHLYNVFFQDFDNETFNLVYKNSTNIVRKIDDKEAFTSLIRKEHFDDKVEVLCIEEDSQWGFQALFRYKLWGIFDDMKGKFIIENNEFSFIK